MEAKFTNQN